MLPHSPLPGHILQAPGKTIIHMILCRVKYQVSGIGCNLQSALVERPPVPGVPLPPGDLESGDDGDARVGAPPGGDGDQAREREELTVEEVVVGEGLVAHRRAGPAPGLEKSGYVI